MKKEISEIFAVDSVIKTLLLCIFTLGSYLIVKLYQFSKQINQHTDNKISNAFMLIAIVLFTISLISIFYGLIHLPDTTFLKGSIGIHVISSIFDIAWIMMVRNRFNLIYGAHKGDKLWLSPFVTSIFHVIYMQFKINQALMKAPSNKGTEISAKNHRIFR
jgi:hypothetical protein